MTEAPERIWMDPDIKFPECEKQYGCDVEYIRKDVSDALVVAAREDALREAADVAIDYGKQQYIANVVNQPQYADDIADDAQEIAGEILALIGRETLPKPKKPNLVGTGVQVGLLKKNPGSVARPEGLGE
jgi:hypothetical protein